jgi:hypothetical protein
VALRVIEIFETLGIEYHLGGSYASSIHGVPRQTQDVDLVAKLQPDQIVPLVRALGSDWPHPNGRLLMIERVQGDEQSLVLVQNWRAKVARAFAPDGDG